MAQDTKTSLVLTQEQEAALVSYLTQRIDALKSENEERIKADQLSWEVYRNQRKSRETPDSIYAKSNVPLPLSAMIVDYFSARAEDALTGNTPVLEFVPQGASDGKPAKDYGRFFNYKLDTMGKVTDTFRMACNPAFVQRGVILKAIYKQDSVRWIDRDRRALFDRSDNKFVKLPGVGPLIEGINQFTPIPLDPNDPEGTTALFSADDPTFMFDPTDHEYRPYPEGVVMETVRFKGAKSVVIASDRFLAPMNIPDLSEADCLCELYDKPLSWAKGVFLPRDWIKYEQYEGMVEKTATPKTQPFQATAGRQSESKTPNLAFDTKNVSVPVIECWVRRDVLDLGFDQEFVVYLDAKTKTPLFYEFTAKIMPDKRTPFSVESLLRNHKTWCADQSLVELLSPYQEFVDKQFNSQAYRNEISANPIAGANVQALEDETEEIELYAGKVFRLKPGHTLKDFLDFAVVPNVDMKTQQLIDFIMQLIQLWLGVSALAQGQQQAIQSVMTATGVEAALQEASKMSRHWMRRLVCLFEDNLKKLVDIAIVTMDEQEVYRFTEGDVSSFGILTPEDLENLSLDVRVTLAPGHKQREVERADMAVKVVTQYVSYPPEIRTVVRPLMEKILCAIGFEDAYTLLPEMQAQPAVGPDGLPVAEEPGAEGAPSGDTALTGAAAGMGNSNTAGQNQYTG